jgi:hypothetical protein
MKFQHSVRDAKKYKEFDKAVELSVYKCLGFLERNLANDGTYIKTGDFRKKEEFSKENGFLLDFYKFKDKLKVNTKNIKGAWGGSQKGVPAISIGRADRCFNKEEFNAMLLRLKNHQKPNWESAIEMAREDKWMYVEYQSFYSHPEIGSFISDSTQDHIDALVAHELAHAIDHFNKDCSHHQKPWKQKYAFLRRELGLVTNNMNWNLKEK